MIFGIAIYCLVCGLLALAAGAPAPAVLFLIAGLVTATVGVVMEIAIAALSNRDDD